MVLLPLLFPFRPATAYVPTHESTTLAADPNLNLETPTSASGITSVYGNSGIGPGVFISNKVALSSKKVRLYA